MRKLLFIILPLALIASKCNEGKPVITSMTLSSSSFNHQGPIPSIYTCEGANQSPQLAWKNVPPKTVSLALIMDDPDAAPLRESHDPYVHWVVWNIDPTANELPANLPATSYAQGINSGTKPGYMGPCPPSGQHRYFFRLYALDTMLNLPTSTTKEALLTAMQGHVLGEAELMGTYKKSH